MQIFSLNKVDRAGLDLFGGLPSLTAHTCNNDMLQAELLYEKQGIRRKGVYVLLAACNKLIGLYNRAYSACMLAKEIKASTALDRLDEMEIWSHCN